MPRDYAEIATKGDPLMAFWTIGTLGYLLSIDPSYVKLILLLLLIFPASAGYYELKQLSEQINVLARKYNTRRQKQRPKKDRVWKLMKAIIGDEDRIAGLSLAAINLLIGVLIYIAYVTPRVVWGKPDTVIIFLFTLPLIWVSTLIWRLLKLI